MGWTHRALAAAVTAAILLGSGTARAQDPEMRAVWASRFEWPSATTATAQANITNIMNTIEANNFNTVFFQVRGQMDTHYPSPYEPWSNTYNWTDPGWDPLQFAIDRAAENGLEFHAYINTHTLASPIPPANTIPQHMYNLHGPSATGSDNWLIHDTGGNPVPSTDSYAWLSPGVPEASYHTRREIMYIVENYDVDGVHFDRIRCPGPGYSYDPTTVARFNGDGNPDNLSWADFMRSQITRDLRNIQGQVLLTKPHVKTSAAPFGIIYKDSTTSYTGTGTQAYHSWYQDGFTWLQTGVLDFMVPQIYWQVGSAHPFENLLYDWQQRRGDRHVVAGSTTNSGGKLVSALMAEHTETRNQNAAGHCIFSVNSMGSYWNSFLTGPYDQKTTVPAMDWKTSPTQGAIVGYVRTTTGVAVLDAKVNMPGDALLSPLGGPYNYLSAWDGFFAILNVPAGGGYSVTGMKAGYGSGSVSNITVTAGQATLVEIILSDSAGSVALDRNTYYAGNVALVSVTDSDLEGSGTVTVNVASATEPGGENLVLTETSPAGHFEGTFAVHFGAPTAADGILHTAVSETITAVYNDADAGGGNPGVSTATASIASPSPALVESRTAGGGLTPSPTYVEFGNAGSWANTTAKSTAPGVVGSGGRFIGNNGLGAYAEFRPEITVPGYYDVQVTLPAASGGPSPGFNNHSPGAGFDITHALGTTTGTFDLSRFNAAITDQWLTLASSVPFDEGTSGVVRITNNHVGTADSGNRFDADAVRFVFVAAYPWFVPVSVSLWDLD